MSARNKQKRGKGSVLKEYNPYYIDKKQNMYYRIAKEAYVFKQLNCNRRVSEE